MFTLEPPSYSLQSKHWNPHLLPVRIQGIPSKSIEFFDTTSVTYVVLSIFFVT